MLGKMDDYFIHQTIDTIDHVATGDPRFQDRLYFNVHGHPGDFVLGLGLGVFPNQAVMDGFVCAVHNGKQYNLRVARPVTNDREDMHAGPLRLQIVEPMRVWRLQLESNPYGICFDLTFTARTAPFEHRPMFRRVDGHVNWHQQHLQQSGVYAGWIEIGGVRQDAHGFWGSRDRSWGVRGPLPGTRLTPPSKHAPSVWLSAQFESWALHGWFGKDENGENTHVDGAVSQVGEAKAGPRFVDWRFDYVRHRHTSVPESMILTFACEGGGEEVLELVKPLLSRNTEGGGYYAGFFGTRRQATHVEGEVWDITDRAFIQANGVMHGEVLCAFRHRGEDGFGIFQSHLLKRAKT